MLKSAGPYADKSARPKVRSITFMYTDTQTHRHKNTHSHTHTCIYLYLIYIYMGYQGVNRSHLFSTGIFINDRKVRGNPFVRGIMRY